MVEVAPSKDVARISAYQDAQRVFRLRDGPFDDGDAGQRVPVFRVDLAHHHRVNDAVVETELEQIQRRLSNVSRLDGDVQLLVQGEQIHVGAGDRAHEGQDHRAARLLRGQQIRPGRFLQTAQTTPEVDLPAPAQGYLIAIECDPRTRQTPACRAEATGCGREKIPTSRDIAAHELLDARGGNEDILVFLQRGAHEIVQDPVVELLPPCGIRHFHRPVQLKPVARRSIDLGSLVIRTDGAAGQQNQKDAKSTSKHARLPSYQIPSRGHRLDGREQTGPLPDG